MAFINESLGENQRYLFPRDLFYKPYNPYKEPIELYRWTVDWDRDVFIISLGTIGPEQPEYFAMSWCKKVIKFAAYVHFEADENVSHASVRKAHATVTWKITSLTIPSALQAIREEVIQLLLEGLDAMGNSNSRREGVDTVKVIFT
ncbi:hypothetical protein [Methyloradius palustris]|nr:hypothetical protein [Methyloradius palustris]